MIRNIAKFYLIAMVAAFVITLYVGSTGARPEQVFLFAMLAWPTSALILLANAKLTSIRGARRTGN